MIAGALLMAAGTIPAFVRLLPVLIASRLAVGAGEAAMMAAAVLWLLSFGAAAAIERKSAVAPLVIPVFGAGVIASRTIFAGIPDRFGAGRTLSCSVLLEAAGLAGVAAAANTPEGLGALVVMAIGQGLAVPSLGLLALASVPASRHGRTAGAFFAYFDAGVGLGGPAVGLAARAADPTGALFAAAAAVLVTAPVALLRARPVARRGRAASRWDAAT